MNAKKRRNKMNNELSHDQITAIKDFARGLQESFASYRKNHSDKLSDIVLEYVNKIIEIHLDLARIKFDRGVLTMAKAYGEK